MKWELERLADSADFTLLLQTLLDNVCTNFSFVGRLKWLSVDSELGQSTVDKTFS